MSAEDARTIGQSHQRNRHLLDQRRAQGSMAAFEAKPRRNQLLPRVQIVLFLARLDLSIVAIDAAYVGRKRGKHRQQRNRRHRADGHRCFLVLLAVLFPSDFFAVVFFAVVADFAIFFFAGAAAASTRSIKPSGRRSFSLSLRSRRAICPVSAS